MRRPNRTAWRGLCGDRSAYPLAVGAAPLPMLAVTGPWDDVTISHLRLVLLALGVVTAAAVAGVGYDLIMRARHGRRRPWMSVRKRVAFRMQPGPRFAGRFQLWWHLGKPAAWRKAKRRPSVSLRTRVRGPWQHYAAYLGDAHGWLWRIRCYASFELLRLVIAPPQTGKSQAAAGMIMDAPGPAVATTIRGDLLALTAGVRQLVGRLFVWNLEGVGEYGSNIRWYIVPGCEDMTVAVRRAGGMVEAIDNKGLSDAQFWADQSSLVLSALLHAAALVRADMRQVHAWVVQRSRDPLQILTDFREHDAGVADSAIVQLEQFLQMPQRTQGSVVTTINNCLRFMSHPAVVEMLTPRAGEQDFDFEAFLNSRDTLYMISGDVDSSPVAPLFAAFLTELTHVARETAQRRTFPRIDPPLLMVLDEIANIAPVPIWKWASFFAGTGITAVIFAQSWAQLVDRWGLAPAQALWDSCRSKIIYAGISSKEILEWVSEQCGKVRVRYSEAMEENYKGTKRSRWHHEDVPALPVEEVRELPDGTAIVIQGTARPTIVRTESVYKRKDYRRWKRRGEPIRLAPPRPYARATPRPHHSGRRPYGPAGGPRTPDELAARRGSRADRRTPAAAPPLPRPSGPRPAPWPGAPIGPSDQPEDWRDGDTIPIPAVPGPDLDQPSDQPWVTPWNRAGRGDQ